MASKNFIEGTQTKVGAKAPDGWIMEQRTQLQDGKAVVMWHTESTRNQNPFHLDYEYPETKDEKPGRDYNMISKHATKAEAEKEMAVQVTARNKQIAEAQTPEPVAKPEGTTPVKKTPEPVKKA